MTNLVNQALLDNFLLRDHRQSFLSLILHKIIQIEMLMLDMVQFLVSLSAKHGLVPFQPRGCKQQWMITAVGLADPLSTRWNLDV